MIEDLIEDKLAKVDADGIRAYLGPGVLLEGEFTAEQLRVIADILDLAKNQDYVLNFNKDLGWLR